MSNKHYNLIHHQHILKLVKPITPEIAELSASLSSTINKDPAARIIAATPIIEKVPLVTADKQLMDSTHLKTIW